MYLRYTGTPYNKRDLKISESRKSLKKIHGLELEWNPKYTLQAIGLKAMRTPWLEEYFYRG